MLMPQTFGKSTGVRRQLRLVCRLIVAVVAFGGPIGLLVGVRPGLAQQPAPGAAPDFNQQQILELKRRALTADPKTQLELYQQVLKINPDDATALDRVDKLKAELDRAAQRNVEDTLAAQDRDAKARLFKAALDAAAQGAVQAKQTRTSAPLTEAEAKLAQARKYAQTPADEQELERVSQLVVAERAVQRTRAYELWGGLGLIGAAAIAGLVFYFWRRPRALEMLDGPEPGRHYALRTENTSIGALQSGVDWFIADVERKVSRHHCDIVRQGRHYFVVDRSTNGTLLNGQRIRPGEPVLLRSGDRIGLGGAVTLIFR
jgi:hypothetical protein